MTKSIVKESYKLLMDLILVNILWLFTSLLTLTIGLGPALTASYKVGNSLINTKKQTYVVKEFFTIFKKEFLGSTLIYLIIFILSISLFFIHNYSINNQLLTLQLFVYISVFQLIVFTLYVFPISAIFETKNIGMLIKNTMLMAYIHPWTTFKLLGSLSLLILLVVKVHSIFILIGFGLFIGLSSVHLNKVFMIYVERSEEKNELS